MYLRPASAGEPWPWKRFCVSSPHNPVLETQRAVSVCCRPIKRNLTASYNDPDALRPVISRRRRNHRRGLQCCAVAMPATAPVERAEGVAGGAAPPACVEGESSERARQREIAA